MAIRLKSQGVEFEVDSSREAMEMYRLLAKTNGSVAETQSAGARTGANRHEDSNGSTILGSNAKRMIRILLAKPRGEKTDIVAAELGVNGPHGLAAINRQIRAFGRVQFSLTDEQCINTETGVVSLAEALASRLRGHEKDFLV